MKLAKTKSEIEKIRKKLMKMGPCKNDEGKKPGKKSQAALIEQEINKYYEIIKDSPTIGYLAANNYAEWVSFCEKEIPCHYEKSRDRYEAFVLGYIFYHEQYVEKPRTEKRVVYFDWGKINKKAGLTIFMNPLYEKKINGNGNGHEKQNYDQSVKMTKTAIANPPSIGVDPPPPPPPPPPPRE